MAAQQEIDLIDRAIDANRLAMFARLRFRPQFSAFEWQSAWDRCPDLRSREDDLNTQRWRAMEKRDAEINRAHKAAQRRYRHAAVRPAHPQVPCQGLSAAVRESDGLRANSQTAAA